MSLSLLSHRAPYFRITCCKINPYTMSKIYLVSCGEYDDYTILGLFSTMEKGESYIAQYAAIDPSEDAKIEEFELDGESDTRAGYNQCVYMQLRDGAVIKEWKYKTLLSPDAVATGCVTSAHSGTIFVRVPNGTLEQAIQAGLEYRAQALAGV